MGLLRSGDSLQNRINEGCGGRPGAPEEYKSYSKLLACTSPFPGRQPRFEEERKSGKGDGRGGRPAGLGGEAEKA